MTPRRPIAWLLVGIAALALAGFGGYAAMSFLAASGPSGPTPAASVAQAQALEATAREGAAGLLRAVADGAIAPDLTPLLDNLRTDVGHLLMTEAQAARLPVAEIERLARLAADLASVRGDAEYLADPRAARVLANSLTDYVAVLAEVEAALRALPAPAAPGAAPWLAVAAAVCAALFLVLAIRAARAAPTPAAVVVAPARAESADEARARFVALMNHELRTPMNGVIGLISVLKEGAVGPDQVRLLEEAERAGKQMASMIEDMLEQEMAGDTAVGDPPPFKVESLAQSVRDLFGPAAARSGVSFAVNTVGEMPAAATGDGRRFLRAISHLCGYVLEKAGARDVRLDISHDGGECRAALSFDFAQGEAAALKLKELVETGAKSPEELTEAGLGPLLAKGLLERMGGRLEVTTTDSGRVLVLAATPSSATEQAAPRVRIMARTRSLGALGAAAATAAGVEVLAAEDAPAPDVVLVEAGGPEEAPTVEAARAAWPRAAVVALGDPAAPPLFDAVIASPLDPDRVAAVVEDCWTRRGGLTLSPLPMQPLAMEPLSAPPLGAAAS